MTLIGFRSGHERSEKKQKQADGIDSTFQCQSLKSAVRIISECNSIQMKATGERQNRSPSFFACSLLIARLLLTASETRTARAEDVEQVGLGQLSYDKGMRILTVT